MSDEKRAYKRMSPAEWAEVCALWELGEVTIDELAEKFEVDRSTLLKRFKAAGIEKGSKAGQVVERVQQQIIDAAADAAAEEALKLAAKKKSTKDDCYQWIEQIQKATMAEIVKAVRNGTPFGVIKSNLQALEKAMSIIATGRKERFELLGLDREDVDPDDLPDLLIRELTPNEIVELQSAGDEDEDLDGLADVDLGDIKEILDGDDEG